MSEDLDLVFSHLPQPYRMICKIIEIEILDPVWLEIIRRHPELQVGSDGLPIDIRRNHMLHNVFTPKQAPIASRQFTSISEISKIIFGSTVIGELIAIDAVSSLPLSSIKIFPQLQDGEELISPTWVAGVGQHPVSNLITVCAAVIYQAVEQAVEAPVGGKKGAKKVAAPVDVEVKKRRKCLLTVASMSMTHVGAIVSPGVLEAVDSLVIDLQETDSDESITVDVFAADRLLAVTTRSGGCTVYPIASWSSEAAVEEGKGETAAPADPTAVQNAKAVCIMNKTEFFSDRTLRAAIFSASSDEQSAGLLHVEAERPALTDAARPQSNSGFGLSGQGSALSGHVSDAVGPSKGADADRDRGLGAGAVKELRQMLDMFALQSKEMVVFFESAREWSLVDLHKPKKSSRKAVVDPAAAAAPAKAAKGKKEEAPPPPAPVNPNLLVATIIGTWRLTSSVSEYKVDERRQSLLLGLADGSVSLWDLRSRTLVSVLCQHAAPVSSLCFCSSPVSSWQPRYLASGSTDGTICFHTSVPNVDIINSSAGIDLSPRPVGATRDPKYATSRLSFRNDVDKASVLRILTQCAVAGFKYPVCVVQYSNEVVAMYDYETSNLLGQVKYSIQRSLSDPTWSPAKVPDVLAVASVVDEEALAAVGTLAAFSEAEEEAEEEEATEKDSATKIMIKKFDPQYVYQQSDGGSAARSFPFLSVFSARGLGAVFVKDSKDELAYVDFKTDDLVLQSYPCLSSLYSEERKDFLSKFFLQLTGDERSCASLPRERVSEILGIVEDRFPSKPGGKGKKLLSGTRGAGGGSTASLGQPSLAMSAANANGRSKSPTSKAKLTSADDASLTSSHASISHAGSAMLVKPWTTEGKDIIADSASDLQSLRSIDSSIVSVLGKAPSSGLELDTALYGDAGFVFDPVHVARRSATRGKINRAASVTTSYGSRTASQSRSSTAVGSAAPKTASRKADPVLSLLNSLADRFKTLPSQ